MLADEYIKSHTQVYTHDNKLVLNTYGSKNDIQVSILALLKSTEWYGTTCTHHYTCTSDGKNNTSNIQHAWNILYFEIK